MLKRLLNRSDDKIAWYMTKYGNIILARDMAKEAYLEKDKDTEKDCIEMLMNSIEAFREDVPKNIRENWRLREIEEMYIQAENRHSSLLHEMRDK